MDKIFHHDHHHKDSEGQQSATDASKQGEQQAGQEKESFGERAKEYLREDEEGEREGTGKEYGGLM
jgi:hypothetical protein